MPGKRFTAEKIINMLRYGRLITREVFDTLVEAKVLVKRWRVEYNQIRPHSYALD